MDELARLPARLCRGSISLVSRAQRCCLLPRPARPVNPESEQALASVKNARLSWLPRRIDRGLRYLAAFLRPSNC